MNIPAPREMVRYSNAATGAVVARILQGVAVEHGRAMAVYIAETPSGRVTKGRFQCAARHITEWARANRIWLNPKETRP